MQMEKKILPSVRKGGIWKSRLRMDPVYSGNEN
jgi:hypothetical protein